MWYPPLNSWIKRNTDGSSSSMSSACGIIFRDSNADCLLCISENLGLVSAFYAELLGAMRAIETAFQRSWTNFWLELDSMLVVMAFSNNDIAPWQLRNRWSNCMKLLINMIFIVSHIFREGNQCVDSLANFGLALQGLFSWETTPSFLSSFLVQNKLDMPNCRFVSF
jgi:ribonuclease HI